MADIPSGISPVKHMYANSSKHHYIEIYLYRMIQVMYSKYVMLYFHVLFDIVGMILYFFINKNINVIRNNPSTLFYIHNHTYNTKTYLQLSSHN